MKRRYANWRGLHALPLVRRRTDGATVEQCIYLEIWGDGYTVAEVTQMPWAGGKRVTGPAVEGPIGAMGDWIAAELAFGVAMAEGLVVTVNMDPWAWLHAAYP